MKRVLLTCSKSNIASAKVIQSQGGVLENEIETSDGEITQRYWIEVGEFGESCLATQDDRSDR